MANVAARTILAGGTQTRLWSATTTGALLLGVVHALVDCASGYLIFRDLGHSSFAYPTIVSLVVLYSTLAFGGQVPVGLAVDRWRAERRAAAAGAALAATALVVARFSVVAGIILVGVGNAGFHVGAGAHVLRASGNRASESGVFVGPGALGLAFGILLGSSAAPARLAIVGLLATSVLLLPQLLAQTPGRAPLPRPSNIPSHAALLALACASLLIGSVAVRAMVGGAVAGTWRGISTEVMTLLAVAACSGKVVGGFLSDRFGWITTSVTALLLSAPLVSALVHTPAGAVLGMLVFQMTMPVTLKAMHHLLPDRPGLAFGVPCLALLVGALPGLYRIQVFPHWAFGLMTVLLSAVLVALGLRLLVRAGGDGGPALGRLQLGRVGTRGPPRGPAG